MSLIVDTSALIAILQREPHGHILQRALIGEPGVLASPTLVELKRLTNGRYSFLRADAEALLADAFAINLVLEPFTPEDARIADAAIPRYGKGNGGPLNFGDLLVYAVHKRTGFPILCTGRDFADTDAVLHPASRRD